ncbi:MAG: PilW family protein [Azonexus sp.]|jgi:type IV pilus assembly protein PilW|nr:PilW family protein [Azonexus sp.]
MRDSRQPSRNRQRGLSLIDLMVGLTISLLVVLAALGSLMVTSSSTRTVTDGASLEQKATLVMVQIGQQISQAGAVVAISNTPSPDLPYVAFDTTALGGINTAAPAVSIYGVDGASNGPDTLVISYTAPNDGAAQAFNCVGNGPVTAGTAQRLVSQFFIKTATASLVCNNDTTVPSTAAAQSLVSDVLDMQVKYLLVDDERNVTFRNAAADIAWSQVAGVQVCLEVQGDVIQAPAQTITSCSGSSKTTTDGRIHRIVRQTFYLRNINT